MTKECNHHPQQPCILCRSNYSAYLGFNPRMATLADDPGYRAWVKTKHPLSNAFGYFDMLKERDHATRLEF